MFASIYCLASPRVRPGLDGIVDGYLFDEVGRSRCTLLSLWPDADSARGASAIAGGVGTVVCDEIYLVRHDVAGPASSKAPGAAALLEFDGPIPPERVVAAERAFAERIRPIVERLDGMVRGLVLRHPETGDERVVNLTDSLETLGATERAVTSSPLLPGEHPALLPGPDRVAIHTVALR